MFICVNTGKFLFKKDSIETINNKHYVRIKHIHFLILCMRNISLILSVFLDLPQTLSNIYEDSYIFSPSLQRIKEIAYTTIEE